MAQVYISLGSNIDRIRNIKAAECCIKESFDYFISSPIYETEAVGFDGENFFNSVVAVQTSMDVYAVAAKLKDIEDQIGRDRSQPKFSARTIDLDLLLYDDLIIKDEQVHIPREEIMFNAFVLKPLVDLAGDKLHPIELKTFRTIWLESDLLDTQLINKGRVDELS